MTTAQVAALAAMRLEHRAAAGHLTRRGVPIVIARKWFTSRQILNNSACHLSTLAERNQNDGGANMPPCAT